MSTKQLPDDLVTVAQYTEMRELGAVQVVNGWCRKQGAPFHEVEGKRMISVKEMDDWQAEKKMKKAEGKGTTHADMVQRRTGVKRGALTIHNAKRGVVLTEISKISDYLAWGQSSHSLGKEGMIPLQWGPLATKIKKGELSLVNPHIMYDLLMAHYEHLGGEEKYERELALLDELRKLSNPEAGEDLVEEVEVPAGEETSEEEESEEDES